MLRRLFRRCSWCWRHGEVTCELARRSGSTDRLSLCVKHAGLLADVASIGHGNASVRELDGDMLEYSFQSDDA